MFNSFFFSQILNFEFKSSNKTILAKWKGQILLICSFWAFQELEVPDGVYDGNLQSLVSISLAFESWRILYRYLERRSHQYSSLVLVRIPWSRTCWDYFQDWSSPGQTCLKFNYLKPKIIFVLSIPWFLKQPAIGGMDNLKPFGIV